MSTTPTNAPTGLVTELIKKLNESSLEVLPLLLFFLYIIGFLCLNVHLAKFPIIETNLISFNYIKASIVFLIFNAPFISVSRKVAYEFKNDRIWSNVVILSYLLNFYCLLYFVYESITIYHSNELTDNEATLRLRALGFTYLAFIIGAIFQKTKKMYMLFAMLVSIVFNIVGLCYFSKSCFIITIYGISASVVFFTILYIDIHLSDKYKNNKSLIIPSYGFAITALIIGFGWFVYGKIPQIFGGGKAYHAVIFITKSEYQVLQESCALSNDNAISQQAKIIYSSDKWFYIDDNSNVLIIPVEAVKGIRVKRWIPSDN